MARRKASALDVNIVTQNPILDLSNCGLTTFPKKVIKFKWVRELILSNTWWDYDTGTVAISKNTGLPNRIDSIPLMIGEMDNLEILRLGNNPGPLTKIAGLSNLSVLTNLQELDLNFVRIGETSDLPVNRSLRKLYIAGNLLPNIANLHHYRNLEVLDLGHSSVGDCRAIGRFTKLQRLFINNCKIKYHNLFPNLQNLEYLNISDCDLTEVDFLESLTNLTGLDISVNPLKSHAVLSRLGNLRYLNCNSNIEFDASTLQHLPHLQTVDISAVKVTNIEFVGTLREVTSLNLSLTLLRNYSFIQSLHQLESLGLAYNRLNEISFLKSLNKIKSLDLSFNRISKVQDLFNLVQFGPQLNVSLRNNSVLNQIPHEVKYAGWRAIHERLAALAANEEFIVLKEIKVLILGNPNVGKSNLLELLETSSEPIGDKPTHGIQFRTLAKTIENVTLNVWDFGGQEYYHATHQLFFSPGALNIVMWCKSNIRRHKDDSFFGLDYWLRSIDYLTNRFSIDSNNEVVICENKVDRSDFLPTKLNQEEIHLKFSKLNIVFTHLNLKPPKYINGFKELIRERSERLYNSYQRKYHDHLRLIRNSSESYLSIEEFEQKSSEFNDSVIRVFHYMGILLYFPDIVPNKIFIKPDRLLDFLYNKIFSNDLILQGRFSLTKKEITESAESSDLHLSFEEVIKLLGHFNLVFQIKHSRKRYFFPQFLPTESNEVKAFADTKFGVVEIFITSDYYLMNLALLRAFSQYGNYAIKFNNKSYGLWRNGIAVRKNGIEILIRFDRGANRIELLSCTAHDNFSLRCELIDFILDSDNPDSPLLTDRSNAHWENDKFDVYVRGDAGYFVKWRELVACVREGDQLIKGTLYSNNDLEAIQRKLVPIDFFKRYLPSELRMKKSVFICYARKDLYYKSELSKYLETLRKDSLIDIWEDGRIQVGSDWDKNIRENLDRADICLILISQELINSSYVNEVELNKIMERRSSGECRIIPVLISACDWQHWKVYPDSITEQLNDESRKFFIKNFQFLPLDDSGRIKPINRWRFKEDAWLQVANAVRRFCLEG